MTIHHQINGSARPPARASVTATEGEAEGTAFRASQTHGSEDLGVTKWSFFLFILIIFLAELSAAILAFIFRENLTREFFTKELTKHYQGSNDTDVFSATWNSVMITFGCCGVNGPEDFKLASVFRLLTLDSEEVPEACCQREPQARDGVLLSREHCLLGQSQFINRQGCYTVILNAFETYVYLAGALAIGVLAIELFVMIFAMCLFRGIQ